MATTDFAIARANMVDGQVRTNDVTNQRLVAAMRTTARETFLPPELAPVAYMSETIEAAPGRYLLDPRTLSKLLQLADLKPGDSVLDVGGVTGYSAAIMAQIAARVTALEIDEAAVEQARGALAAAGIANVEIVAGPLATGHKAGAPYDVIVLNGAVPARPDALIEQLKIGGRLVGIVTDTGVGKAHIFVKTAAGLSSRVAFDATVARLPGFEIAPVFQF